MVRYNGSAGKGVVLHVPLAADRIAPRAGDRIACDGLFAYLTPQAAGARMRMAEPGVMAQLPSEAIYASGGGLEVADQDLAYRLNAPYGIPAGAFTFALPGNGSSHTKSA